MGKPSNFAIIINLQCTYEFWCGALYTVDVNMCWLSESCLKAGVGARVGPGWEIWRFVLISRILEISLEVYTSFDKRQVCVLCKLSLIFSTYSLRNFMGHHFVRQRTIPFKNTDSTKSLCIKWGTRKLSPNPLLSVSGWMSALKSKSHRGPQLCPTTSAHHPALAFRQNQDLPREGESHTHPCLCTLMASIGLCGTLQLPWGECFWSLVCVSPSVSQKELI